MKTTLLLLTLALVGLTACAPDLNNVVPNAPSSISNVTEVCTFSDGRRLFMFEIARSGYQHTDRIYFFKKTGEADPISINRVIPQGKTTRNETIVQIPE